MIDVERVRSELPAVREAAYLNAGTFGPLPTPVRDAVVGYVERAHRRGRIGRPGLEDWLGLTADARAAFARALGAEVEDVALTGSATDGVNLVLSGLDWEPGDEIVTTSSEHPAVTEPLVVAARRRGVVVREAAVAEAPDAVAEIEARITDRTRLVAVSHVLWTTGAVLPIAEITRVAHEAGALVLVDGAQSIGALHVSMDELHCDFYAVPGQKWLCGPSGTGALHVRSGRLDVLEPAWPWYGTRERPPGEDPREWGTARRLDVAGLSLGACAGIVEAVAWRERIGWTDGFTRAADLCARLRGELASTPGIALAPAQGRSTLVAFAVEGRDSADVAAGLEENGVLVRSLPGTPWLRASVGFWNDESDLARLLAGLRGV